MTEQYDTAIRRSWENIDRVLNSCTYIGNALSTYGIALLSKGIGWSKTVLVWFLIALAGTGLCLICIRPWAKEHPVQ